MGNCKISYARSAECRLYFSVFAALGIALQIFSGHPQFVYYTCIILLIYAISSVDVSQKGREKLRPLAILSCIILLAIFLAAIQLVPTLQFAFESPRRFGSGYDWATTYSLKPNELMWMLCAPVWNRYMVPSSGDPNVVGFYMGWPVLMLALWAYLCRDKLNAFHIKVLTLIAFLGFVLALGKYLPGYRFLYQAFLPFKIFRFPAQALYLACFGISFLAAYGMDGLKSNAKKKGILAVLIVFDLWIFSWRAIQTIDPSFYTTRTGTVRFLKERGIESRFMLTPRTRSITLRAGPSRLAAAIKYIDTLYPNLGMAFGLYDADGLQELRFRKYDEILDEVGKNALTPWIDVLGIRYIFSFWENLPDKFSLIQANPFFIYENSNAFPKAYLVPNAIYLPDEQTIPFVDANPNHDFHKTVIINSSKSRDIDHDKGRKKGWGKARIVHYEANKVAIEVQSSAPAWLVLSDNYDRGWSATIYGSKTVVHRANYVQRAVRVPEGSSLVVFKYRPPLFNVGMGISLISVMLSIGIFLVGRKIRVSEKIGASRGN